MATSPNAAPSLSGRSKAILGGVGVLALGVAAVAIAGGGGGREVDVTIPAGTTIVAALQGTVSTENGEVGTPIRLESTESVALGDGFSLPAGIELRGEVTHLKGGGRVAGAPELTLRFNEMSVNGTDHRISAEPFRLRGRNDAAQSAAIIGGGAVVGGVVGAVTGAGTVEGAVVGGVLGTGVAIATKGDQLVVPAGAKLRIRLTESLVVRIPASARTGDQDDQ
jgi:hypothetical protein